MAKVREKRGSKKAGTGNITIDLGETIEKKLRAAGLSSGEGRAKMAGPSGRRLGMFAGGRSGAVAGGHRPWYSRFGRPWMGQEPRAGAYTFIPPAIASVKTSDVLTGLALGTVMNRATVRITKALWQGQSEMLYDGIGVVVGLIPLLIKRSGTMLGVAVPGAVMFGAALVDALGDLALGKAEMAGSPRVGAADAAQSARQRLASIQARIAAPQQQRNLPRVVAQPA